MAVLLMFLGIAAAIYGPWWVAFVLGAAAVYHGRHTIIGERAALDAERQRRRDRHLPPGFFGP